ncbi:MAG: class I SAM-dependent methyltransferase [Promethearchaeota archaeon]
MKHLEYEESLNCIQLKKSTAKFYEESFFEMILEDILHPGGLELTERLANFANIDEESSVLDIASGKGASAIFLAQNFNCNIVGVDLSKGIVKKAIDLANTNMFSDRDKISFKVSDAEKLPFRTGAFDVVISECALCLFPNKKSALTEMYRVLKDGGKIALSDVTLENTSRELRNKLLFFGCLAGAESLNVLQNMIEDIGFIDVNAIDSSQAVIDLYKSVKRRSFLLKHLLKIVGNSKNGDINVKNLVEFGKTAEQLILEGKLGYGIITGRKTY